MGSFIAESYANKQNNANNGVDYGAGYGGGNGIGPGSDVVEARNANRELLLNKQHGTARIVVTNQLQ